MQYIRKFSIGMEYENGFLKLLNHKTNMILANNTNICYNIVGMNIRMCEDELKYIHELS